MNKHLKIRVKGIVQGVGFRPFIYRIAEKYNIFGIVINDTEGVLIHAEGREESLHQFINEISANSPPLSFIRSITSEECELENYTSFSIGKSKTTKERQALYSPDVTLCNECRDEFFDEKNRRYHYPFITCINCGPRFSIIYDIPYDRNNTTMSKFELCKNCYSEYTDFKDRRFHTQPIACNVCGPYISLYDNLGNFISNDIEFIAEETVRLIKTGKILAIKGIGGYHLAADALNDNSVIKLRERKNRPFKPFALMASGIDAVEKILHVSPVEREFLLSKERPIVLLSKKIEYISQNVAPGMSSLGFMLPYTPFQELLFSLDRDMILIMTSGNLSDEPIVYEDDEAFKRLGRIADYIITFNREIIVHADDSVVFVQKEKPIFIRRSKGYIPLPFNSVETSHNILALGGDLKNSFAVAKKDFVILSQFLGDMADPETELTFRKTVDHFIKIFDIKPNVVVSDMHPGYMTKLFADEWDTEGVRRIEVQHHHAHIASVLEDRDIDEKIIGIAFDGTGYGPDSTLWGSEFMIADRNSYERVSHFSYFPLPGGESAIKDVWKIGLSLLYRSYGTDFPVMKKNKMTDNLIEIIDKEINSPDTCSIGRIFDGISAILGIRETISTEAEAAQLLEEAALKGNRDIKPFLIPFSNSSEMIISTDELVRYIVSMINNECSLEDIAFAFHLAIAYTSVKIVESLRNRYDINKVALSGGVFHNRIILSLMLGYLESSGFDVFLPEKVPFNDGCIALGQIAVAKSMLN